MSVIVPFFGGEGKRGNAAAPYPAVGQPLPEGEGKQCALHLREREGEW